MTLKEQLAELQTINTGYAWQKGAWKKQCEHILAEIIERLESPQYVENVTQLPSREAERLADAILANDVTKLIDQFGYGEKITMGHVTRALANLVKRGKISRVSYIRDQGTDKAGD